MKPSYPKGLRHLRHLDQILLRPRDKRKVFSLLPGRVENIMKRFGPVRQKYLL